jgi:biopolymer transport protein ExbD
MAFGGSGGTRKPKSDINVTPLVDVVLVLLIIFLVAMPVLLRNITIDIPKKTEDQPDVVMPDQITVEVQEGGIIMLNGQTVERAQLAEKLRSRLETKREKVVFVDFHEKYRYGDAVQIMDTVKGAGATTVALKIKEPAQPGAPGAPGTPAPVTPPQ